MGVSHGKKYLRHKSKPHLKYYFMKYKQRGKKNPQQPEKGNNVSSVLPALFMLNV